MLKYFSVKNFLSFNKEITFSMQTGRVRGKRDHVSEIRGCNLLKFSAIYGSNAAGKSNFIYAMRFARRTILKGIPKNSMGRYHRIDPENKNKPTEFTFEIRLGKRQYRYCFSLNLYTSTFLTESLIDISTTKPIEIFSRDLISNKQHIHSLAKNVQANRRIEAYLEDMDEDASVLFLKEMNRNKTQAYKTIPELSVFQDIYNWFDKKLRIIMPADNRSPQQSTLFTKYDAEAICTLLQKFNLNITNTHLEADSLDHLFAPLPAEIAEDCKNDLLQSFQEHRKRYPELPTRAILSGPSSDLYSIELDNDDNIICHRIQFVHDCYGSFDLSEESDGTRRLTELINILLSDEDDVTYVVDELDRSLHPLITKRFVQLFLEDRMVANQQLIVSTHESRLLDLSFLRKDEIWFMTKSKGVSILDTLESFGVRPDLKIDVAYLKGKLVQVPMW